MSSTGRLPFDPQRVAEPDQDDRDRPLTVAQLTSQVKQVVATGFPAKVRVIGQVSNLSDRAHWFFSLKDDAASLRCVCFASAARKISFDVQDGLEVIATGRVDFYPEQGQLQLYVDRLEPVGQGALEMQFRALCETLRGLGYFDVERKKPLPAMPQRIAVITSRSAAALQDVINTTAQRWPGCRLLLHDVRVQGDAAAGQIAAAIQSLSRQGQRLGIGAILLTRGGGSIEDLWAFNERVVADAVFKCRLPIVAAIGHETDTTIAELVADVRCATPTQAAMTLVPDGRALAHQVDQLASRLTLLLRRRHAEGSQRLVAIARHRLFSRPEQLYVPFRARLADLTRRVAGQMQRMRLDPARQRLSSARQQFARTIGRRMERDRGRLESIERQLHTLGPANVLKRGYSYTLDAAGNVVRRASDVEAGDRITTVLVDGRVRSRVEGSRAAPKRSERPADEQPGLFQDDG